MATVLITGANRGIGLGLAQQYAGAGVEVIACCRDLARAQALEELAAASDGRVCVTQLDVADDASIAALKDNLGDKPIDILINNAGVLGPENQSAILIDAAGWMTTMRVNGLAPILVAQAVRENLLRGHEKKVVAIGASSGSTSHDSWAGHADGLNRYAYRASKAALNNGMRGLARDWAADGVSVGIVAPGWVQTDMGGPAARLSVDDSARGIIGWIAKLGPETSGVFQRYWGEPIPW